MMSHSRHLIGLAAFSITLMSAGCSTPSQVRKVAGGLDLPAKQEVAQVGEIDRGPADTRPSHLQVTDTPRIGQGGSDVAGANISEAMPPMSGGPVNVNVQNVPLPVFANEVFGNLLDLNISMTPEVSQLQDLVTLRTEAKQRPQDLFLLARQVLAEYGVGVNVEGKLVRLAKAPVGTSLSPPLIISGRASPTVPLSHRPVFQLIELEVVRSGDAARWLGTLYGQELKVQDEAGRNSIIVSGKPAHVQQAIEALRVFDRPLMRGRVSSRLEPAFMSSEQLADRLVDVLNVQGYGANRTVGSPSSVIVLPITAVNSVLIFANTQETLDYAVSWARELDRPSQQAGGQSLFYYQVKNTKAKDIASVLDGATKNSVMPSNQNPPPAAGGTPAAPPATLAQASSSKLQVDEPRNALIYQGDPAQWERMLTLVRQMDRAPRQVMIEVTIAEVKLGNDQRFGLTWFAKYGWGSLNGKLSSGVSSGTGGGGGGNSGSGGGLSYLLDDLTGRNRLALTAFANDTNVSVISTPRLLVKSGSEASMDIGDEVPTISMTTTSGQQTGGTSNLLQSVQYRKTGVLLNIKPTIYSDNRVDLDLSQEVSQALPLGDNATGGSPTISNRSIQTSLSLKDGQTVVLGGLISNNDTHSDSGVPLLKDVPVLGNLFKSKDKKKSKTELVLVIVPYIVESDDRAMAVSQAIIDRLEYMDLEQFPKSYSPPNEPAAPPPPASEKQTLPPSFSIP